MNGGKANPAEAKIHIIGKLVSIISGLTILVAIILLVYRPEIQSLNIINDDSYQNLPRGYKIYFPLLFKRTELFSLALGGFALLGLISGIGFILRKNWARHILEIITWLINFIVLYYLINFLIFIFDMNRIVPGVEITGIKAMVIRFFGLLISMIYVLIIYLLYKFARILRKKEIRKLLA